MNIKQIDHENTNIFMFSQFLQVVWRTTWTLITRKYRNTRCHISEHWSLKAGNLAPMKIEKDIGLDAIKNNKIKSNE